MTQATVIQQVFPTHQLNTERLCMKIECAYLSGRPGKAKTTQVNEFNDISTESYEMGDR